MAGLTVNALRRTTNLILLVILLANAVAGSGAKQHPKLPVLGYVTPWHARGNQLVELYRDKFDIVCPVWYTVRPSKDSVAVYEVEGGTPRDEDKDWYQRLQEGPKPLRVAPRFLLDGWNPDDFKHLMYNETRWARLSDVILEVVDDMAFDGVVFESAGTHLVRGPLGVLSEALWDKGRILVAVVPPIVGATGQANDLSEQAVTELSNVVDYFSVMTYDMYGPAGHEYATPFPAGSPLLPAQQQHSIRKPGPNTSSSWIQNNLMAFAQALSNRRENTAQDPLRMTERSDKTETGRFLMGLPLYSYKYPVYTVDQPSGKILRFADDGDAVAAHEFVILRGPGEAVVMSQILELINEHEPQMQKEYDDDKHESYFDYVDKDGRWRVFVPTPESMSAVLGDVPGVALWEVGQSSTELLEVL